MLPRITIIDYDAGNLRNVQKAFEHLGCHTNITKCADDILRAEALVLPGVGAFLDGMAMLESLGLVEAIRHVVLSEQKPILGICLGMQLFALSGEEGGRREGLNILPMTIERLRSDKMGMRLPHIGWNNVYIDIENELFASLPKNPDFYFVHSYHAVCADKSIVTAICKYGQEFVAAVRKGNIFATQFHPEKSQRYGLKVLANFINCCRQQAKK